MSSLMAKGLLESGFFIFAAVPKRRLKILRRQK